MKTFLLALPLLLAVSTTHAQSIYRCDAAPGEFAFQDRPCANPQVQSPPAIDSAGEPLRQAFSVDGEFAAEDEMQLAFAEQRRALKQQRDGWRREGRARNKAETLRVRELLSAQLAVRAAGYAQDQQRCETAMQVAALCGKYAGTFSCNAKGFKHIGGAVNTPISALTGNGNGAAFNVEHCALQAMQGR